MIVGYFLSMKSVYMSIFKIHLLNLSKLGIFSVFNSDCCRFFFYILPSYKGFLDNIPQLFDVHALV